MTAARGESPRPREGRGFHEPIVSSGVPVGEALSVSFPDLVRMLAEGIADAQAALDRGAAGLMEELATTMVPLRPRNQGSRRRRRQHRLRRGGSAGGLPARPRRHADLLPVLRIHGRGRDGHLDRRRARGVAVPKTPLRPPCRHRCPAGGAEAQPRPEGALEADGETGAGADAGPVGAEPRGHPGNLMAGGEADLSGFLEAAGRSLEEAQRQLGPGESDSGLSARWRSRRSVGSEGHARGNEGESRAATHLERCGADRCDSSQSTADPVRGGRGRNAAARPRLAPAQRRRGDRRGAEPRGRRPAQGSRRGPRVRRNLVPETGDWLVRGLVPTTASCARSSSQMRGPEAGMAEISLARTCAAS